MGRWKVHAHCVEAIVEKRGVSIAVVTIPSAA